MKTSIRHEFKYIISYVDYYKIIEPIKGLLVHDQHGDNINYLVNSVYLDDVYHSGAADKAFGNEIHKKYRIRNYNNKNERQLELKEKSGEVSTKYTTSINDKLFKAIINNDTATIADDISDALIRRFYLDMNLNMLSPKCNITYQREAYRDESNNLRITFDHTLETSLFDSEIDSANIKLIKDSMLILEIKYEHYFPKQVSQIFKSISLNQIAYSKYFMGYNQIIL